MNACCSTCWHAYAIDGDAYCLNPAIWGRPTQAVHCDARETGRIPGPFVYRKADLPQSLVVPPFAGDPIRVAPVL
jgi:hypothetical protein